MILHPFILAHLSEAEQAVQQLEKQGVTVTLPMPGLPNRWILT